MKTIFFLLCITIIFFSSAPLKAEEFNVEVGAFVSANNETVIFQITNYEPFPLACDYIRTNVSYIDSVTHKTIGKRGVRSGKFNVDSKGNEFTIEAGKEVILAFKSQFPNAQVDKIEGPTTYLCKRSNTSNKYKAILKIEKPFVPFLDLLSSKTAFSNDGKKLASIFPSYSIKIWDSTTGKEIITLLGHDGPVTSIHFNKDGTKLVSSSWDSTIKIWDVNTGRILQSLQLTGEEAQYDAARFSPDGKTVVSSSCSSHDPLIIWDVMTGRLIRTLIPKHSIGCVRSMRFSPDGNKIVTGSSDHPTEDGAGVYLWDLKGNSYQELLSHSESIHSVDFSPDGTQVLSAGEDATIRLFSASGVALKILKGHHGQIFSASFSPNGKKIVSGGWDKTARIWDVENGQEINRIDHNEIVQFVAFSPCGTKVATETIRDAIQIWQEEEFDEISSPITIPFFYKKPYTQGRMSL